MFRKIIPLAACLFLVACAEEPVPETTVEPLVEGQARPEIYADFTLTADLTYLTDNQREMIGILIEAANIMDGLFWRQAYGDDYRSFLDSLGVGDAGRFAEINYGPWDRLDGNRPF